MSEPTIVTNDATRHDWSHAQKRCLSCGLTAVDLYRMRMKLNNVYCKARRAPDAP